MHEIPVEVTVNGRRHSATVEPRLTLADYLREKCGLTGTHLGCEHGACGACTVLLDGQAVRACLVFAVQVDGQEITTVEGIAGENGELSPVQAAMKVASRLRAGQINVNNVAPDPGAPFGGFKQSGNGREWGEHAFADFLEIKAVMGATPASK